MKGRLMGVPCRVDQILPWILNCLVPFASGNLYCITGIVSLARRIKANFHPPGTG
jgi:hypothetical protein